MLTNLHPDPLPHGNNQFAIEGKESWGSCWKTSQLVSGCCLAIQAFQKKILITNRFYSAKVYNLSVVHIYFNVDSVYPRLRKEMNTIIELICKGIHIYCSSIQKTFRIVHFCFPRVSIANAGGLLGLCMGFSMLSLLEIVYYVTVRLFCASYRERALRKQLIRNDNDRIRKTNIKEERFLGNVFRPGITRQLTGWKSFIRDQSDAAIFERVERGQFNSSFEGEYGHAYNDKWPTCFILFL